MGIPNHLSLMVVAYKCVVLNCTYSQLSLHYTYLYLFIPIYHDSNFFIINNSIIHNLAIIQIKFFKLSTDESIAQKFLKFCGGYNEGMGLSLRKQK